MTKEKNKGGRPKIEVNMEQMKQLCGIFCTQQECASVLGISPDTVALAVKEAGYAGFSEYFKIHSGTGKASLRRMQWKAAQNGNTSILIWLGKQYLGQTEQGSMTDADAPLPLINFRAEVVVGLEKKNES